ncbi:MULTISPECIES: DUF2634 domain-containing protein [unclassified Aerococcus]|uniref:DUF2634 domain-containing protein n=1 Tax=unclassified Aerococcus TaxID=2618060 RepID=UPI0025C53F9A|nr:MULTISPECIES: DUF2634 domain-containing protein [unclassified Aerococcus]
MFDDEEVPTRTYRILHGRILGFVDGQEAMRQAIEKILSTPRFQYEIYSESYGHDLEDMVGEEMALAEMEVERLISEALLVDDRILSIENFNITPGVDRSSLQVSFIVSTLFGDIAEEMEVEL